MRNVVGNLWEYPAQVRVITTNGYVKVSGAAVMGRGCACEARDAIPGIDVRLGDLILVHGNRPFRLSAELWTMPVKVRYDRAVSVDLIERSARSLVEMADKFGVFDLVLPRPGCGNGRLSWHEVEPVLAPILDDRFKVITFPPWGA